MSLEYINETLRSLAVEIDSLTPDPANERIHDRKNIEVIKESLRRFGQHQVVTVWKEKGIIIIGNGRWLAMRELGYTHIAANFKSFNDAEATACRIADNRTSDLASWDEAALTATVEALKSNDYPLDDVGFSEEEVKAILGTTFADYTPEPEEKKDTGDKTEDTGSDEPVKITLTVKDMEIRAPLKHAIISLIEDRKWEGVEIS